MQIRDRIKELRRVRAGDLRPNPRNWRTHPAAQRDALRGLLAEVGYAAALVARELPDGALELIDGHLRAETAPESLVPVLVLDVDAAEAAKLLATLDPLAGLAGADGELLSQLLGEVHAESPAVRQLLGDLAEQHGAAAAGLALPAAEDVPIEPSYQVVADCRDEAEQRRAYELLAAHEFACRVLTL